MAPDEWELHFVAHSDVEDPKGRGGQGFPHALTELAKKIGLVTWAKRTLYDLIQGTRRGGETLFRKGLSPSATCWMVSAGRTTGPPTPMCPTRSAATIRWWKCERVESE